ncbi:MAG: alpha/beta hydrolase [Candidatus Binatus sp.]|uniref:alpha/beta fold hydrolase n=1 Tax=Candidatus Binatus sp. TaxID=2811406 RepID=UPI002728CB7C|nr:alpha/beta hydrolase [Candidatus Binatus sp.]MDO8434061.1 alpha/beta hydrolase [Candidatus Binatus sp.]
MESNEPKSSFLEVNGIRLHTLDWGGAGDPIVLLHATGFLGRIYRPIAERLRTIGHVFSYDQRGHGDSSAAPNREYDWLWTMKDLEGFITKMGFAGVRAFGHSAGATAIGSLASERPDLISRGVLVEPVLFETPDSPELGWRNPFVERTLKRKRVFDSVEAMFSNFDHKPPYDTWRKDILRDYCEFGTRQNSDGKRELKCSPEDEAKIYATSQEFDGLQRILRCEAPLLIMFGMKSDSLAASLSGKIAKELKRGRVIDVPETGHFMPMEAPDYVADQAIEFLAAK